MKWILNVDTSLLRSRVERSSDQIIKPVNLAALTKWVGNIPEDVVNEMAEIAPMLSVLGYDPYANPPVYGAPDSLVSDNTRRYVLICYAIWLLVTLRARSAVCTGVRVTLKQPRFKAPRAQLISQLIETFDDSLISTFV